MNYEHKTVNIPEEIARMKSDLSKGLINIEGVFDRINLMISVLEHRLHRIPDDSEDPKDLNNAKRIAEHIWLLVQAEEEIRKLMKNS